MDSLRLSFNAIAPIFLLMLVGYVIKCLHITDKKGFNAANKLVFNVFLPILLFYNIYKTDMNHIFDSKLVMFTVVGLLAIFAAGYFAVFGITKDNRRRGVMLQGFFRTNFAILGIPLVTYICGDKAGGLASLMVAIIIPIFNILAVISLERFRGGSKLNLFKLLKGIITNPLIIGCAIGIIFFVYKISLPSALERAVSDLSSIATPLAIVVLGAEFEFSGVRGYGKDIFVSVFTRLILIPAIMIPIAVLLGFTGEALACILITFGAPIAVSSFAMSQQMGGDETLAAQNIVISSAFCLPTLFMWIFVLNYFNLF